MRILPGCCLYMQFIDESMQIGVDVSEQLLGKGMKSNGPKLLRGLGYFSNIPYGNAESCIL